MSDTTAAKSNPTTASEMAEVRGLFPSNATLEDAVARLAEAGFDHADLSLPQAAQTTPERAVTTGIDRQQARTLGTSMAGSVGMVAAAGLTVATGGALAAAAAVGLAAGVGAGVLAEAAGSAVGTTGQDARDQAARAGTLVLAVRLTAPGRRARAEQAMQAAGATKVAAVTRTAAAIDSAAWTG